LPPPDLAGLDEGGGALSFFGACNCHQIKSETRKLEHSNRNRIDENCTETYHEIRSQMAGAFRLGTAAEGGNHYHKPI